MYSMLPLSKFAPSTSRPVAHRMWGWTWERTPEVHRTFKLRDFVRHECPVGSVM